MSATLTPNLMTDNLNETIQFYCEHLGFEFDMGILCNSEKPLSSFTPDIALQWAMLKRDGAMLMLQERSSLAQDCSLFSHIPVAASASFYIEMNNLDAQLSKLGDDVERVVPERITFYGMREVWVRDNNGYVIVLAEKTT
jgi:uncharacterized glyoxalase superfamily protein PhnB